jgi:superfamily II DNA helicase RecQ
MRQFTRFIVDEAHLTVLWGVNHDGQEPFSVSWGLIFAVRRRLYHKPPILAMTATAPPALPQRIVTTLRLDDPAIFRISANRVNHIYAVHRVVGSLSNMANLRMIVPNTLSADAPATRQTLLSLVKKTLIFMDSKKLITAAPHAL